MDADGIRGEAGAGKSTLLRVARGERQPRWVHHQLSSWNDRCRSCETARFADRPLPRGDEFCISRVAGVRTHPTEWVHRQSRMTPFSWWTALTSCAVRSGQGAPPGCGVARQYKNLRVVVTSRPTAIAPKWLVAEGFESVSWSR